MDLETFKEDEKREEIKSKEAIDEIKFPHAEKVIRMFQDKYEEEPEKAEIIKAVLYDFFEQAMENTQIYKSKELGASFPWTVIKTGELAKEVFNKYSETKFQDSGEKEPEKPISRQEFIFSSGSLMKSGYQFTFIEEAMHQAIVSLLGDLKAIKKGEEPERREIYTLGLPTNELGKISEDFSDKVDRDPFGSMANLQGEFIKTRIPEKNYQEEKKEHISFYGVSTGASFAAATGEKLLNEDIVTQSLESEDNVPRLSIKMVSPVGLSESNAKGWQIPVGYFIEGAYQFFDDPKFRISDLKFMGQVKEFLKKKGICENMSEQDKKFKRGAIDSVVSKIKEGVKIDDNLKVTKVSGIFDPLMFSSEAYREFRRKELENLKEKKSLGKNIFPRKKENEREIKVRMTHTHALFYNELKRYHKLAGEIQKLNNLEQD